MMNVSSNEKFTFKICSDIIKATTNNSSDGGGAIQQRTVYFERFV